MRKTNRFSFIALFMGFVLVLGACSTESEPPEGLAFQESQDSGDVPEDTTSTTEAAPTTTESTVPKVNRPTNRTCSANDYSIAFPADLALIAPSPATGGPFSVSVPAGTYDIVVWSWLGLEDFPTHVNERWYFTTDSGYTSPLSTDSSPELITADLFSNQTLGATSSITVHHSAPGSAEANSVHPLCIGFRTVSAPQTTSVETTTTTVAETTTTTVAETTTTIQVAGPTTTTTAAPTTTTVSDVQPAQLALTGASDLSMSLGLAGAALTLAGVATLIAARREEDEL